MSATSPLVRMIPLQPSELPAHPLLASTDSEDTSRPDLLPFIFALLDHGDSVFDPSSFDQQFKSHSTRSAPPSSTEVESLTYTIPSSEISQIKWDDLTLSAGVGRTKPREVPTEHWVARRSYHANVSSKEDGGTACWPEFVFGLRDNHSKNEGEFTPTLFDARHILDWNSQLETVAAQQSAEQSGKHSYSSLTLGIYEMCHEIPFPLQPRCFPVLVATASTSDTRFIAVTVPVNLSSFEGAFYSTGRNRTEGESPARRKQIVLGIYAAVEKCELISRPKSKGAAAAAEGSEETEEVIEWVMGTASDAKGNVPMTFQKSSMPSQVAKDVSYFLKWINTVDDDVIKGKKPQIFMTDEVAEKTPNRKSSWIPGSTK